MPWQGFKSACQGIFFETLPGNLLEGVMSVLTKAIIIAAVAILAANHISFIGSITGPGA